MTRTAPPPCDAGRARGASRFRVDSSPPTASGNRPAPPGRGCARRRRNRRPAAGRFPARFEVVGTLAFGGDDAQGLEQAAAKRLVEGLLVGGVDRPPWTGAGPPCAPRPRGDHAAGVDGDAAAATHPRSRATAGSGAAGRCSRAAEGARLLGDGSRRLAGGRSPRRGFAAAGRLPGCRPQRVERSRIGMIRPTLFLLRRRSACHLSDGSGAAERCQSAPGRRGAPPAPGQARRRGVVAADRTRNPSGSATSPRRAPRRAGG